MAFRPLVTGTEISAAVCGPMWEPFHPKLTVLFNPSRVASDKISRPKGLQFLGAAFAGGNDSGAVGAAGGSVICGVYTGQKTEGYIMLYHYE